MTRSATRSRPGCSAGKGDKSWRYLKITDLRTEIQLKDGVVHAVDGVTLHVDEGETLGVVGESGCGKTMTALTIMQLLPNGGRIAGGSIKLGGRELTGLSRTTCARSAATRSG